MNRFFASAMALGASLALAAPALAQGQGGQEQPEPETQPEETQAPGQQQPEQQQQPGQEKEPQQQQQQQKADVAIEGSLRGRISRVDMNRGRVALNTGQGTITFYAKPNQIADLRAGETFIAQYANFGDRMWLMGNLDADVVGKRRAFGKESTTTGEAVEVQKEEGRLTLSTTGQRQMTLRAHPAQLETIQAGQSVSVQYQRVGQSLWVQSVEPQSGGAGEQP